MAVFPSRTSPERPLYAWIAFAAVLVVLVGFARTYYLKFAFGAAPLSALLHVHGLVMSAWFLVFGLQAWLGATGRVGVHRRLGVAGAIIALLVVGMGTAVALVAAGEGRSPPGAPPPLVFLAVPLGDMVAFALLAGLGLALRRRRDTHKRLMLLATIALLVAPLARFPSDAWQATGIAGPAAAMAGIVITVVAWDTLRNRRLHPALGWGGLLLIASWPLRLAFASTGAWQRFAAALVS